MATAFCSGQALQTLANIGSEEIASELDHNPLAMDEDDNLSSEDELSDIAEGEEGEAKNTPAGVTAVFGNEDGDAERAMDSLDQMSVDDLLRLKREFIKASFPCQP